MEIEPRLNSKPICSKCHKKGTVYDHKAEPRLFEFIPIWGIKVYFRYVMRRVDCKTCKVRVEKVPWVEGKSHLTKV